MQRARAREHSHTHTHTVTHTDTHAVIVVHLVRNYLYTHTDTHARTQQRPRSNNVRTICEDFVTTQPQLVLASPAAAASVAAAAAACTDDSDWTFVIGPINDFGYCKCARSWDSWPDAGHMLCVDVSSDLWVVSHSEWVVLVIYSDGRAQPVNAPKSHYLCAVDGAHLVEACAYGYASRWLNHTQCRALITTTIDG